MPRDARRPTNRSMPAVAILLVLLGTALSAIAAAAAEDKDENTEAAQADWIWHSTIRQPGASGFFRKTFDIGGPLAQARLKVTGDFCRLQVLVNGQLLDEIDHDGRIVAVDAEPYLRQGRNVLALAAWDASGPAATALRLELEFADGSKQLVVTDPSWQVARKSENGWHSADFAAADWASPRSFGSLAREAWWTVDGDISINPFDDYTQWKQALGSGAVNQPGRFLVPPGFSLELLRSAEENEGSWVSMTFDPQGRIVIGREDQGLLRMTLAPGGASIADVESINDTLKECRGLRFAHGHLFANANESRGLYRLAPDSAGEHFAEPHLVYRSSGGAGHGRNDLALGPHGMIYSIHGDAVDLPAVDSVDGTLVDRTSPFVEHRRGQKTREGHLLRIDPAGTKVELFCSGLRNPFGIALNEHSEAFTYDADAEHDMGAPWYRPTRVSHLVSGGDYGWRGVTGQWPPYFPDRPDNAPPNLDIGKGSPTSVLFGTASAFPPAYRRALFILDWAYGRILAVHMRPHGSSYACRAETFLRGRPLNVTGIDFGPDGAMYFVTGGRKTQSGLYRLRSVGAASAGEKVTSQMAARAGASRTARALRRRLEMFHGKQDPQIVDTAWPHLNSRDARIRHAARIAIEHQPLAAWRERALSEQRTTAALEAWLALGRSEDEAAASAVLERLAGWELKSLTRRQQLTALYLSEQCLATLGEEVGDRLRKRLIAQLDPMLPRHWPAVNQRLTWLLAELGAASVPRKSLQLLAAAADQREQMHYLFVLRKSRRGWTGELRRQYFQWFGKLRYFTGGRGMPDFIKLIRKDALAGIDQPERKKWEAFLDKQDQDAATEAQPMPRPLVREWKLEDLLAALGQVDGGRDFEQGRAMFTAALCVRCHRLGHEGFPLGPDLTSLAARFSRRDMLQSILEPSKVVDEKYRNVQVVTDGGKVIVGRLVPGGDYRSELLRIATDPLTPDSIVEIPKAEIETHRRLPSSAMPDGLLNTLTREQILDLLAYIEAAGQPDHRAFQ